jgi:hypothetical protein
VVFLLVLYTMTWCASQQETTLFLLMLYSHQFKESFSRALLHNYADWVLASINDEERFKLLDSCLDRGELLSFEEVLGGSAAVAQILALRDNAELTVLPSTLQ